MGEEARLTRRRLVGTAAAGAAATTVPGGVERALGAGGRRDPRRADVVVVGAGLAGLTAAMKIADAGRSVVVLEARRRVGGRTLNHPIGGGEVIDAGAEFIGPTQNRIKRMARRMGVDTFPTYNTGNNVYVKDGLRIPYPADTPLGVVPPDPLLGADIVQIVAKLDLMATEVPVGAPWSAPQAKEWDSQTLHTWFKSNDVNPDLITAGTTATQTIVGADPRDISLLFALFYIAAAGDERNQGTFERLFQTQDGAQQDRFDGGSQLIAIRMAHRLGDAVVLGAPVRRIAHSSSGVEVRAKGITVHGERVIVAMPPTLTGRIIYQPKLPFLRDQLTQRTPMGTYAKVDVVYPRPFWRDEGLTGFGLSLAGPVRATFDTTPRGGRPGALLGFVGGHEARKLFSRPKRERRRIVLGQFAAYFGERARHPDQYIESHWSEQRFSRGDPDAVLPPGVLLDFGKVLRKPVGHIHWAGTETSTYWNGYMDGAVRSGERAAREVLAEL